MYHSLKNIPSTRASSLAQGSDVIAKVGEDEEQHFVRHQRLQIWPTLGLLALASLLVVVHRLRLGQHHWQTQRVSTVGNNCTHTHHRTRTTAHAHAGRK